MKKITIKTPARLHFGIININNPNYNLYGCLGCTIQEPNFLIEVEESEELIFENLRREDLLSKFIEYFHKKNYTKKIKFKVIKEIEPHIGLGSTTQICLAYSLALAYFNKERFDLYSAAKFFNIGKISGIGIGAFLYGGFLIDGGKKEEEIPRIVFRHEIPEDWIFLVIRDKMQSKGLSDKEEYEIINSLPPTESTRIESMQNLVSIMKDSIKEKNIEKFGKALTEFQINVGKSFYSYQKGIYTHPNNEKIIKFMLKHGAYGAGQSSWGPTVYGLFDERSINKVVESIKESFDETIFLYITNANNNGVEIKNDNKLRRMVENL